MKRFFQRLSTKKQESNSHSSPVKSSWPSVSSNSLPATGHGRCSNPPFQESQQSSMPAPLAVHQNHDSTEAGNFSTAPLPNSELGKQATRPMQHPHIRTHADTPMLHQSRSREASVSDSAFATATQLASQSTSSDHARQHSQNCSQHQPASIYKSYDDFDIMSSGTFDFGQHHLLSSAPDADWLNQECVSHRLPDRPKTATEKPQGPVSYQWEPEPTRTPSPRHQPASQPNSSRRHIPHNPAKFGSPHESARYGTLPHSGPSPTAARQNAGRSPVNQPMATPFAKYASRPMSGPLLSADLDSAMRADGQALMQPRQDGSLDGQTAGEQHELLAFSRLFCHAACRLTL